jgi:phenylalanyl-tRNA synthetase beta chain
MRIPLTWLSEYITLNVEPGELAHKLTMNGIESSYVPGPSASWHGIFVGEVQAIEAHPNADRLRLATVTIGEDSHTVVCGAPNLENGQRVAFAQIGATLIDSRNGQSTTLEAATIRGTRSDGMICSELELGLGTDHSGILVLPSSAPIGAALNKVIDYRSFEVEITPNRGDCLSVLGIAREISAITGEPITEPSLDYDEGPDSIHESIGVTVEDHSLCQRYMASAIKGIEVGPSPLWLRNRLESSGHRSINNVVDVTNYVMLEYGQPLHAFDLGKIGERTIFVRQAKLEEAIRTLDETDRTLTPPMLIIADPDGPIGLAGIMGGSNSEVTEETTEIVLEAANFDPINIRITASTLRLRTEASLRFEKGLDAALAEIAIRRATGLILEVAGGKAFGGLIDEVTALTERRPVRFSVNRMRQIMGTDFATDEGNGMNESSNILRSLGFKVDKVNNDEADVTPPYWRMDIAIEQDIVEEVARISGYDNIPMEPLSGIIPDIPPNNHIEMREQTRDLLVDIGFQETISYSLISRELLESTRSLGAGQPEPLRVANPMSREQEYLRNTLRGNILRNTAMTLRHPHQTLRLFEIGRGFISRSNQLPNEKDFLVATIAGPRGDSMWDRDSAPLDFFDLKGVLTSIMTKLGVRYKMVTSEDLLLHPGRAASILIEDIPIGIIGELHPQIIQEFDIPISKVGFLEVDLHALSNEAPDIKYRFTPFSRYPIADRDLGLMVDVSISAGELQIILESHPLVKRASLFDWFSGNDLPQGKKSLAFRLELQSETETLSTEAISSTINNLLRNLEERTGAVLRD